MGVIAFAAFAGLVAIGATVAVERFGGRLGGVIGTLPTTIVPASLGFAAASTSSELRDTLSMVPLGLTLDAGFLWLWRVLPARLPAGALALRLATLTALTLGAWCVGAVALVLGTDALLARGVSAPLIGVAASGLLLGLGLALCRDLPPAPKGTRRVGALTLAARGVFAATAIGAALWLAEVAGPVAGGVASVFPAIFLTAMVSLWLSQGEAVPVGAIGPIVLGSSSVSVYALVAAMTMPALGGWGVLVAWSVAVLGVSAPAAGLLSLRRDPLARTRAPT